MAKCTNCDSTILLGGKKFSKYTFCDDGCMAKFKIGLVDKYLPPAEVDKAVDEVYNGKCPSCRGDGPVDLYSSDTVTGFIVAYTTASEKAVCCVSCGRKMKLKAALHCTFLGWWGVKAAIHNIIYLPKNLIGAAVIKAPVEKSKDLTLAIKGAIAEKSFYKLNQLHIENAR